MCRRTADAITPTVGGLELWRKSVVSFDIASHPHCQTLGRELNRRVGSFPHFGAGHDSTFRLFAGKKDGGGATAAFSLAAVHFGLISPRPPQFSAQTNSGEASTWPRAAMGFHYNNPIVFVTMALVTDRLSSFPSLFLRLHPPRSYRRGR